MKLRAGISSAFDILLVCLMSSRVRGKDVECCRYEVRWFVYQTESQANGRLPSEEEEISAADVR
jgi:hypothetical protein